MRRGMLPERAGSVGPQERAWLDPSRPERELCPQPLSSTVVACAGTWRGRNGAARSHRRLGRSIRPANDSRGPPCPVRRLRQQAGGFRGRASRVGRGSLGARGRKTLAKNVGMLCGRLLKSGRTRAAGRPGEVRAACRASPEGHAGGGCARFRTCRSAGREATRRAPLPLQRTRDALKKARGRAPPAETDDASDAARPGAAAAPEGWATVRRGSLETRRLSLGGVLGIVG